jgi:DNA sulfur modification protein DndC
LHEIRRIWRKERQDWEDSVPLIYAEMTGETLDWLAG